MRHAIRDAKGRFCKTNNEAVKNTPDLALGYAIGYKMFRESYFGEGKKYNVGDIITDFPEDSTHDRHSIYLYVDPQQCIKQEGLLNRAGDLGILCKVTALEKAYSRSNTAYKTTKVRIDEVVDLSEVMDDTNTLEGYKLSTPSWDYTFNDIENTACLIDNGGDVVHTGDNTIQVSDWAARNYIGGDNSISITINDDSDITSKGDNNILVALGGASKVKGKKGNLLMLVEYGFGGIIEHGLAVIVDGKKVKEDTWYTIKNGKLVKADA